MNRERQGFHISHVYSLWQNILHYSINFDLGTFTLKFDLLFNKFNLGHYLWTVRDGAFIFHSVFLVTRPFTLYMYHNFWPNDLDLWKTFTKCCYFNMVASLRTSLFSDNSCWIFLCVGAFVIEPSQISSLFSQDQSDIQKRTDCFVPGYNFNRSAISHLDNLR